MTSCVSSSGPPVVTHADTPLTTPTNGARTSACTSDAKFAVLADLLADLPAPERREVIASLPTEDRAAIAKVVAAGAIE